MTLKTKIAKTIKRLIIWIPIGLTIWGLTYLLGVYILFKDSLSSERNSEELGAAVAIFSLFICFGIILFYPVKWVLKNSKE